MYNVLRLLLVVILVFGSVGISSVALSADLRVLPGLKWKHLFGDEENSYQNKIVSVSSDGSSLLIAGTYMKSEKGKSQRNIEGIWVWHINSKGKRVAGIQIENGADAQGKFVAVEALSSFNNEVFIVVRSTTRETSLLKFNKKGKMVFISPLGEKRHVSKILHLPDGALLLIGHESLNLLLLKIDNSGSIVRRNTFDREKSDLFVDGIVHEGQFILLENSGVLEQFFMGASEIWISKYDSDIKKIEEESFPGRYGSIIQNPGKGFIVLYDKSSTSAQEIHVRGISESLKEMWDSTVVETQFGLEKFKIGYFGVGKYVIVGTANGKPWVGSVGSTGELIWRFVNTEAVGTLGIDIEAFGEEAYLVSTKVHLSGEMKINNKISVVKFNPKEFENTIK